ncbi:MAG: peptidase M22 [Syntrophomonadaceae bacterium]|jgi:N6-L-threonylcarbamoyladenine synthase|nr:peptidase M22 [Syntrophomonadaceae bacterium]
MAWYLGIDTSAYTTSVSVVDAIGNVVLDLRNLLEVAPGRRGLRQSEALFLHQKNLPQLFVQIDKEYFAGLKGIGVSSRPRPMKDSYMPVFLAGVSIAKIIAAVLGVRLYEVSHQEGHIMAGIEPGHVLRRETSFLGIHFSGGTSEILKIAMGAGTYFDIELIGASADLHVGQLIDRIGVAMGLNFPAGPELERLALKADGRNDKFLSSAVKDLRFSFSGAEAAALRMIEQGYSKEEIAFCTLRMVANTLEKVLVNAQERTGLNKVLLVGGVMSNQIVKERLRDRLENAPRGFELYFAEPGLCGDNAVGTARMAAVMAEINERGIV